MFYATKTPAFGIVEAGGSTTTPMLCLELPDAFLTSHWIGFIAFELHMTSGVLKEFQVYRNSNFTTGGLTMNCVGTLYKNISYTDYETYEFVYPVVNYQSGSQKYLVLSAKTTNAVTCLLYFHGFYAFKFNM